MAAPLSSADAATVSSNGVFVGRVLERTMVAAVNIYNEGAGVVGHAARAALATNVLLHPTQYQAALAQVTAATLQTAVGTPANIPGFLDAELDTAIASIWNVMAGA